MIVVKVILVLLAICFGLSTLYRGGQYSGIGGNLVEHDAPFSVEYPYIKWAFPFREFVIDFIITVILIIAIICL